MLLPLCCVSLNCTELGSWQLCQDQAPKIWHDKPLTSSFQFVPKEDNSPKCRKKSWTKTKQLLSFPLSVCYELLSDPQALVILQDCPAPFFLTLAWPFTPGYGSIWAILGEIRCLHDNQATNSQWKAVRPVANPPEVSRPIRVRCLKMQGWTEEKARAIHSLLPV